MSQDARPEHRLAAVMATDIVGYSNLMQSDEAAALAALGAIREATQHQIRAHRGRIANTAGDSVVAEFGSAVDAVNSALGLQQELSGTFRTREFLPLPSKPSIAVLPFDDLSSDHDQEYFADGIVEEIITALSHFRGLFVIARNSTFSYKGRAVNVKEVGGELGVRYILEGSVRKAGNRVRINGQLIDTSTGVHLWADRFDGSLEDISTYKTKSQPMWLVPSRRSSSRPRSNRSKSARCYCVIGIEVAGPIHKHLYERWPS